MKILLVEALDDVRGKLISLTEDSGCVEHPSKYVGYNFERVQLKNPHQVKAKAHSKRITSRKKKAVNHHK